MCIHLSVPRSSEICAWCSGLCLRLVPSSYSSVSMWKTEMNPFHMTPALYQKAILRACESNGSQSGGLDPARVAHQRSCFSGIYTTIQNSGKLYLWCNNENTLWLGSPHMMNCIKGGGAASGRLRAAVLFYVISIHIQQWFLKCDSWEQQLHHLGTCQDYKVSVELMNSIRSGTMQCRL